MIDKKNVIFDELHKILAKKVKTTFYNALISLKLYTILSTGIIFKSIGSIHNIEYSHFVLGIELWS